MGLAGCTSAPRVDPDAAPPSRDELAAMAQEAREKVVDCLQERGWDVVLEADGWSMEGATAEQADAYERDQRECQELSGANDIPVPPLTDERLEELYAYEVELAECLRAEGYDIPEAPSEQAFVELYTTEDAWYAYRFVTPTSEDAWKALQVSCPQFGS